MDSYDDSGGNVYRDTPGNDNVYNELSISSSDINGGRSPNNVGGSSPPPPLLPKKGSSFRQTSTLLDRQYHDMPQPKPVPRSRKHSKDLALSSVADVPLKKVDGQRFSKSFDFYPPTLITSETDIKAGGLSGSLDSKSFSSMAADEIPPSSLQISRNTPPPPARSHRPVPIPRTRTLLKKNTVNTDEGKKQEVTKVPVINTRGDGAEIAVLRSESNNTHVADLPRQSNVGQIESWISKEFGFCDGNNIPDQQEKSDEVVSPLQDKIIAEEDADDKPNGVSMSQSSTLPFVPRVPPRPTNVSQSSFDYPTKEDAQISDGRSDFASWDSVTNGDQSNSDFFNFELFSSSRASASDDLWPGTDKNNSSTGAGPEGVSIDNTCINPSDPLSELSKKSDSHFTDPFGSSVFEKSSLSSSIPSHIDLGDFDPLFTNKTDEPQKTSTVTFHQESKIQHSSPSLNDPFSSPPNPEPATQGTNMFTSFDSFNSTKNNDSSQQIYSFAQNDNPSVPPKPTKLLAHAPSFHYNPPTIPPPPLPETKADGIPAMVPPPVPPRPTTMATASADSNANLPIAATRLSNFPDLPTPTFSPMEESADPFHGTDFSNECYTFNKSLTLNKNNPNSQASDFTPTPSPIAAAGGDNDVYEDITEAGASAQDPCQDPGRISRFVIPVPGSNSQGNSPCFDDDPSAIYQLAEEISSSDSELGDEPVGMRSDRGLWTPPGHVAGLPVLDSDQLTPKKNQRYGYLYKQGGYNANKGWKKRWVVFNGNTLSYFDNNTSQVSKRIIPVSCMKEVVIHDVKSNDKHNFKFKVFTTLQDRVFIFSAEQLEDCVLWASSIMAVITDYKKGKMDIKNSTSEDKSDKEGFIKFGNMRKYYVVITGHHLRYFRSFKDFQMGSPIHEVDMKLASVKVRDRKRCRLQLWLNYDHFDLSFENDSDMQAWRMAMEDAIAEGLADDTVLEKVYHNISNQTCADCGADKPHWASINLGIVVCKNCAGIHRMFDYHVSKIRSLRMDTRVWTPSLIELMISIGNANSNAFWEYNLKAEMKPTPACSTQERKAFIHYKYLNKKYCDHHPLRGTAKELGQELHKVAETDNLLEAVQVLFSGADVLYRKDGCDETAYDIAKEAGQRLIMELLYQNCGDPQSVVEDEEDENRLREDIRLQGFLNKTGPGGKTYDKRWCILEHGSLTYYLNEKSLTSKGSIDRRHIMLIEEVTLDRPGFHFDISTNNSSNRENRVYSFSSDSRDEAGEWMRTLAKLIAPVAVMEHVGMIDIKFAGYALVRESIGNEWKQSFLVFTWRGLYYMNKDLRLDYIDLRKASSIRLQDLEDSGYKSGAEKGPCCIICCIGKSLYLQAPLSRDTDKMYNALLCGVKGSGRTLNDQVLTNENVPVIVEKCVTHVAKLGLEEQGIYRIGAQSSRIQALLDEFRRDAGSVVLESYSVHEVANVLKRFLRELDDSVFLRINYQQWTGMAACEDVNNRLMWYKYYLEKMPSVNYSTLKRLVQHLSRVAIYSKTNQMSVINLATCFAPSLLRTERDMPDLMSNTTSREINIMVDLVQYQDYFFQQDKENEREINDKIRIAEEKIMQISLEGSASNSNMESILTPVHMINPGGPAVNILVTESTKAQSALDYFKRSRASSDIDTSSFALYELVSKGDIVRPLFPDELMSPTVKRWMDWEEWVKEDNSVSLCARNMDLLEKLDAHYNPTHVLLSRLHYCDGNHKKFKRYSVGFRQCKLAIYNNPKAVVEISSWNVEDLTFYIGVMPKRSTPTKHCLTFLVDQEKISKTVGQFGHCLCFETEEELYRWVAALYVTQHPGGFLMWNSEKRK